MIPYFCLLAFVLGIILFQEQIGTLKIRIEKKEYDVIPFVAYAVFLLFYSVRDYIGYDYGMYYHTVEGGYADDVYASKGEFISAWLLDIATYFGNPHIFFFLTAAISFACIIYACQKHIKIKAGLGWGLLVFLALPLGFIYTLSIQRQFVAVAILMFGIKYLWNRKIVKYLVVTALASMAHMSSFLCILLYLVQSKFVNKKILFSICVMGLLLTSKAEAIVAYLFPFYIQYVEASAIAKDGGGTTQFILYVLILFFSMAFYYFVRDKERYNFFFKNYIFGFILMLVLFPFDASVSFRLGGFSLLNAIFLIPLWPSAFTGVSRMYFKLLLAMALSFAYYYGLITTVADFYVPYKTFL